MWKIRMDPRNYDTIRDLEQGNWWYASRRDLLQRILRARGNRSQAIIDVGCGVGSNCSVLQEIAEIVVGVDIEEKAIEYAKRRSPSTIFLEGSVLDLPFPNNTFDVVVCLDVLEHTEDEEALSEIARILTSEGILILTVPASMALWNINDVFSKHRLRYEKEGLHQLLQGFFEIYRLQYWNFLLYAPVRIMGPLSLRGMTQKRLRNNLSLIPRPLNRFLLVLMKIENSLISRSRSFPPIGVSLVAVVKKKSTVHTRQGT